MADNIVLLLHGQSLSDHLRVSHSGSRTLHRATRLPSNISSLAELGHKYLPLAGLLLRCGQFWNVQHFHIIDVRASIRFKYAAYQATQWHARGRPYHR